MPKGCKRCGVILPEPTPAGVAVCTHCGQSNVTAGALSRAQLTVLVAASFVALIVVATLFSNYRMAARLTELERRLREAPVQHSVAGPAGNTDHLRVRSITVVDASGTPRIELAVKEFPDKAGSYGRFAMYSPTGTGQIVMEESEGESQIFLRQSFTDGVILTARPQRGGEIELWTPAANAGTSQRIRRITSQKDDSHD